MISNNKQGHNNNINNNNNNNNNNINNNYYNKRTSIQLGWEIIVISEVIFTSCFFFKGKNKRGQIGILPKRMIFWCKIFSTINNENARKKDIVYS